MKKRHLSDPKFTSHESCHQIPISIISDDKIWLPFHVVKDFGCSILLI